MKNREAAGAQPAPTPEPPIVLFGVDDDGKPRAARFEGASPDLVGKAAAVMNLKLCTADTDGLAAVAQQLPVGRLYANGHGFVPYIRRNLYAKLLQAAAIPAPAREPQPEIPPADPNVDPRLNPATIPIAQGFPRSWDDIEVGHLVVAQENAVDGWWEAVVIARDGDMLKLRWRDYPRMPIAVRHRHAVALLRPADQ